MRGGSIDDIEGDIDAVPAGAARAGGADGGRASGEYPSEWAAICSLAEKFGMTPETLSKWLRRAEVDGGQRPGLTSAERENHERRRANEILRAASAFFARELDPRPPKW